MVEEIWVVDNKSIDNTLSVAKQAADTFPFPKVRVFQNKVNVSLGGTHKIVFREAQKIGATHVLILHGDNQAISAEASTLIQLSKKSNEISILGSRFMKGSNLIGYDTRRIMGNYVLNLIYSLFTFRKLSDLGSGLNLFRISDLRPEIYNNFPNSLGFNYSLILDLTKRKIPFKYIPITWQEENQISNTKNISIFFEALRILLFSKNKPTNHGWDATGWKEI